MVPADPAPLNFPKTQRLVLLIDLHPLLTLQSPSSYLSAVTSIVGRLLRFLPLSASLSTFKFFFSSISPLRSASFLPGHLSTPSLSFNLPSQTLDSLSTAFNSISTLSDLANPPCCSRASYAASSLIQLIHDYAWETEHDDLLGEYDFLNGQLMKIPSNLVILLSPLAQSVDNFVEYLEMREFHEVFCAVREAFALKDIHLCWVDVRSEAIQIEGADLKENGCSSNLVNLRNGIGKMGWSFCSSDLIVLGSALLPLGLIYPKIILSFDSVNLFGGIEKKKHSGELSLEILDVKGMPLECKCCDLEFVSLKSLPFSIKNGDIVNDTESRDPQSVHIQDGFQLHLSNGKVKLHVKSVHRYNDSENTGGLSEIVLVRECFQQSNKNKTSSADDFFADGVLEMLHGEMGGITCRNQLPTWQMFLSFLHTRDYGAFVSILSSNGNTLTGCLKPFTTHLAILYIFDASHVLVSTEHINNSDMCRGSQTDTSTSVNCVEYVDGKSKKSQRTLYQKMTWSSFCKAAVEGSNFDLFELYISSRYFEKSKRLKFLKCWMKQISKVDVILSKALPESKFVEELSACNQFSSEPSPSKQEAPPVSNSETLETFFNSISKKIQHGLESGMDLQNLAERVVKSSVGWLQHNSGTENNSDDSYSESVDEKLIQLLLKSPKEIKKIQQDSDPCSSENIVREYEMQIFLRMEILRSNASAMLRECRKRKLMKQICSLLEIIQYLVAGGIHGHVSLYDYVERTIRARYSVELEDVVNKIYIEMDLLPFGDEEQSPSLVFNSEDSSHSWRDKYDRNDKAESNSINQSFSTEGDSSQPPTNACDSPQKIQDDNEYTQILNEARERRERARRFAPFVSKARDLQRVWAPKQPKAMKNKLDPIPNKSKRNKDKQRADYYTCSRVVCETPMTGNKRACSRGNDDGDKARNDLRKSAYLVSKALFQDN